MSVGKVDSLNPFVMREGEALILQRQLQRRFGPLPEWVTEKLAQADQTSLETWADRVLDARTLEEVFAEGC